MDLSTSKINDSDLIEAKIPNLGTVILLIDKIFIDGQLTEKSKFYNCKVIIKRIIQFEPFRTNYNQTWFYRPLDDLNEELIKIRVKGTRRKINYLLNESR